MPVRNVEPAFIYPVERPNRRMNFSLYPDTQRMKFKTHGSSTAHPSLNHNIVQVTGRASPLEDISLLFDDVEDQTLGTNGPAANADFSQEPFARSAWEAYLWFRRELAEGGLMTAQGGQIFRVNLFGGVHNVVIWESALDVLTSHKDGVPKRFRLDLAMEQFFPTVLDPRLFGKKKRPPKKQQIDFAKVPSSIFGGITAALRRVGQSIAVVGRATSDNVDSPAVSTERRELPPSFNPGAFPSIEDQVTLRNATRRLAVQVLVGGLRPAAAAAVARDAGF